MHERLSFGEMLQRQWAENKFVSVGLDADLEHLPPFRFSHAKDSARGFYERLGVFRNFLAPIIDATASVACAYKINSAFYEYGGEGESAIEKCVGYLNSRYPHIPVIGDVKRADIGNTNKGYAQMAFERYKFDAITTNPYFGNDVYPPFLAYPGKGLLVLCKTSNPGAPMWQDAPVDLNFYREVQHFKGLPLSEQEWDVLQEAAKTYAHELKEMLDTKIKIKKDFLHLPLCRIVALRTATLDKAYPKNTLGLVIGATYPEEFKSARNLAPDLPFLIPGIGKQKGDLEKTLCNAPDKDGVGMIINSSSGILFASKGRDFTEAAGKEASALHNKIIGFRANTASS